MTVLAYITDLFFQAKVGEIAKHAGADLKIFTSLYKFIPELTKNPDLILIDLSAEGISGPALISQIKQTNGDIPVVAYGPHVDSSTIRYARQAGAEEVLPKSEFTDKLASILERFSGKGKKES